MGQRHAAYRALGLLGLAIALALTAAPSAPAVPPAFEEVVVARGLDQPTGAAYAPDGSLFVVERAGRLRVMTPDGVLQAEPVLDISDHVNSYVDRGLLGVAVDPQFGVANRYVYLLYVFEHDPERPHFGKTSRLTRVTVGPDLKAGPETVLVGSVAKPGCPDPGSDCLPVEDPMHSIGTVRFAPDGTLFLGNGDGLTSGSRLGDPRVFRPYDPHSLAGKILHVDRNGKGLADRPFCKGEANLDKACTKVFATGFRNPFRFSVHPDGKVVAADVGNQWWEELDVVEAGRSYGWPCYEGSRPARGYEADPRCVAEYAKPPGTHTPPVFERAHADGAASILGAPRYDRDAARPWAYPAKYGGAVFFGDTVLGSLDHLRLGGGTALDVEAFGTTAGEYPVDLLTDPATGDLVYVSLMEGDVRRIAYAPTDKTPIARAAADPEWGDMTVEFSGEGSRDPLGQSVTFHWDFGDGATSTQRNPEHTYEDPGRYVVRLTVSDGAKSASAQVVVFPGHQPPAVTIADVTRDAAFAAGERVALEGSATDEDGNELSGTSLVWHVDLMHADHVHPLGRFTGGSTGFHAVVGHDTDSFYVAKLTATDALGLSRTEDAWLLPRTTTVTIASEPPGAQVVQGSGTGEAPLVRESVVGFRGLLEAQESFVRDGRLWAFDRWSDGGERGHTITIPDAPLSLTAFYRDDGPASGGEGSAEPQAADSGDPSLPDPGVSLLRPDRSGPAVRLRRGSLGRRLRGTVSDPAGVSAVKVALRTPKQRGRCRWWSARRRTLRAPASCTRPRWIGARLGPRRAKRTWTADLGRRPPRRSYVVLLQAVDRAGNRSILSAARRRR